MKTKHLLTAMVLPALFAACTNDDFTEPAGNTATGLAGRKVVENITLNFEDPVADTRLAYNGADYKWENSDEIGACLMDDIIKEKYELSQTEPWDVIWSEMFEFTDYIHTNYKFTKNGTEWTTDAKMSEGNYFFYYPYDANAGLRNAYTIDRTTQVLKNTDRATLLKAYTGNNSFVGYGKVKRGNQEGEALDITMVPAFGATGITLQNVGTTDSYVIEKIVLRGDSVYGEATIDPTKCTDKVQFKWTDENEKDLGSLQNEGLSTNNAFNVAQYLSDGDEDMKNINQKGTYNPTWSKYDKIAAMKDVLDYTSGQITVELKAGNVLAHNGGTLNIVAMVRPVEKIPTVVEESEENKTGNKGKVVLDIHTDKGLIRNIELNNKYTSTNGFVTGSGTVSNLVTDKAVAALGDGKSVLVKFDNTALDVPNNMDIQGDDELANLIHWNANTSAPITANLKTDVTFTKAMYNELAKSKIETVTINGGKQDGVEGKKVTIAADVPAAALDRLTFTGVEKIIVKGTQTLAKAKTSPIEVEAGATLNVEGNKAYAKIDNYGTLNIKSKVDENGEICNNEGATMTVAKGMELTDKVTVTNEAEWYEPVATINNAGIIRKLINKKSNAVVNNAATATIGTQALISALANVDSKNEGGLINNNGKVFLSQNEGNVRANGTSTTFIYDNTYTGGDGETVNANIIITKLEKDGNVLSASGREGNLVQEIAAAATTDDVDVARANTVWLSAALKVAPNKDKDGLFQNVTMQNITIVATGANARVDGNGLNAKTANKNIQTFQIKQIVVNADATMRLAEVRATVTEADVIMKGYNNHPATLIVNSNAALLKSGNASASLTVNGSAYTANKTNVVENGSASTQF